MPHVYTAWNGPMPTTAAQASVSTGTTIKTMLQIAAPSNRKLTVLSWGYSIDTAQGAAGTVELLETGTVAATVTAHVAAGVQPRDAGNPASLVTLSTTATGYTSSSEGAIVATRVFDAHKHNSGSTGASELMEYTRLWLPHEAPVISVSSFLRVRVTMGTSAGMLCWITWME
jgi:hypothetical protein